MILFPVFEPACYGFRSDNEMNVFVCKNLGQILFANIFLFYFNPNCAAAVKQRAALSRCMMPLWLAVLLTLSQKVSGLECHLVVWLNDKWIALSASNGFIHPFFFWWHHHFIPWDGFIRPVCPGQDWNFVCKACVCVSGFFFLNMLLYASVHKMWVLLLRGRYDVEN